MPTRFVLSVVRLGKWRHDRAVMCLTLYQVQTQSYSFIKKKVPLSLLSALSIKQACVTKIVLLYILLPGKYTNVETIQLYKSMDGLIVLDNFIFSEVQCIISLIININL